MSPGHDGGGPPRETATYETGNRPEAAREERSALPAYRRCPDPAAARARQEERSRALARRRLAEAREEVPAPGAEPVPVSLRRRAVAAYRLPPVREPAPGRSPLARVDPLVPVTANAVTGEPCPTCGCRCSGAAVMTAEPHSARRWGLSC